MNKKKKIEKKADSSLSRFFHKHPITIRSVAFIAFIIYLLFWVYSDRTEIYKLKKEGVVTPGYIYNERSGVKADYYWYYRFTLSKGVFKGTSRGGDEGKHTGDSILVVYLPSDPTINRSLAFLEKYWHYQQTK